MPYCLKRFLSVFIDNRIYMRTSDFVSRIIFSTKITLNSYQKNVVRKNENFTLLENVCQENLMGL